MSICDGGRPRASSDDDHERQEGGDRPVDADQRRHRGHEQSDDQQQRAPLGPGPGDDLLPGPRRDARRIERLAHDEQPRDEDDRRVAEACESLGERQHPGEVQGDRYADRDDAERDAIADERDDREDQDHECCNDGVHVAHDSQPPADAAIDPSGRFPCGRAFGATGSRTVKRAQTFCQTATGPTRNRPDRRGHRCLWTDRGIEWPDIRRGQLRLDRHNHRQRK